MTNEEDDPFKYLSYVTLREGWVVLKGTFLGWLFLSAVFIVADVFIEFSAAVTESFWGILPQPLWYALGFAVFTWFARGEEFRIVFPQSFRLWLLLTLVVALMVLSSSVFPSWVMMPVYTAVILSFGALASLGAIGKENYQRLCEQPNDGV